MQATPGAEGALPVRRAALLGGLLLAVLLLSLWITRSPIEVPILATVAAILFLATVLRAEAGLVILILSMLLSPEIPVAGLGGGGLGGGRSLVLRTEGPLPLLGGFARIARTGIDTDLGAVRRTRR